MNKTPLARALELVPQRTSLSTPSGARTEVDGNAIVIHAPDGTLLVRYDADTGALVLSARTSVAISAKSGSISLDSETLEINAKNARIAVGEWNLDAERIVERTFDVFRTVEGIAETHARRMRTIVERTLEFCSRRTTVTSKEDTRIDGKRVLLG